MTQTSTGQRAAWRVGPLGGALSACREHFLWAAIFSASVNILYLAPTLYMLQVYDRVIASRSALTLVFLTLIFVFAVGTLMTLDHARTRLLARVGVRLERALSEPILSALLGSTYGLRTSTIIREFDVLRHSMTGPGIIALFDAPWTPIYLLFCFLLHPLIGLLALGGCITLSGLTWLNERATKVPLDLANEAAARAYRSLDYSALLSSTIRALGMRNAMIQRHLNERALSSQLQAEANFASADIMAATKFARLLLQSLALGLGTYLAIRQQISAGAIFAASLMVTRALAPIENMLGAWKSVVQGRAAWTMLGELFRMADADRQFTNLPEPQGRLDLERIGVMSPDQSRSLLSAVSLHLDPGESLGIIGPSGAGKSTLAKVIVGAMPIRTGEVRFDGASQGDWDSETLARYVGFLPQDPTLFAGSLKENIARFQSDTEGSKELIDAAVVRAAKLAGAHELILGLPQGYDTVLGLGGSGLSAGQAQRIALARALYGNPTYVVLDEPNAHLDGEGESQLIYALGQMRLRKVTVLIVAHRLGVLASVDKLIVLKEGRVEIFGDRAMVIQRMSSALASTPATTHHGPDQRTAVKANRPGLHDQ